MGRPGALARKIKYSDKKAYLTHTKYIFVALGTLLVAGLFGKLNNTTYAANTILGSNNQVVAVNTTDGQPINAYYYVNGYTQDGSAFLFTAQTATNLPNASLHGGLYLYNINTNTTTRVDVSSSGVQGNGSVLDAQLSETGRYVLFASGSTNLIDGTTTSGQRVFVHDLQTGTTIVAPNGGTYVDSGGGNTDKTLGISNDGRFALIGSRYTANSYPYAYGITYGDNGSGSFNWTLLSKGSDIEGGSNSTDMVGGLSCDGTIVAYQHLYTILLTDLRHNTTTTLTTSAGTSTSPIISCNGRYVLYATTNRTEITPTPTGMNSYLHLVRYDRITGARMYVDSDSSGTFSAGTYSYSTSNPAPRNILKASIADTGDVLVNYKVGSNYFEYLKHLSDGSGTLEPIAKTASGGSINVSSGTITGDGRYIFFSADPYDLGLASSPAGAQIIRVKTGL